VFVELDRPNCGIAAPSGAAVRVGTDTGVDPTSVDPLELAAGALLFGSEVDSEGEFECGGLVAAGVGTATGFGESFSEGGMGGGGDGGVGVVISAGVAVVDEASDVVACGFLRGTGVLASDSNLFAKIDRFLRCRINQNRKPAPTQSTVNNVRTAGCCHNDNGVGGGFRTNGRARNSLL